LEKVSNGIFQALTCWLINICGFNWNTNEAIQLMVYFALH